MTFSRSFAVFSGAMLAMLAAVPAQSIAQESGTAGASEALVGPSNPETPGQEGLTVTIPATRNYGTGGRTGSRSMFACDVEGSFFRPNRSFLSDTDSQRSLPCNLRETLYRLDGDHGGGGGRPNPADPTSAAYPDTRFNLADALDDYRVSGGKRAVTNPPSSLGLAAQPVNRQPLEPQLEEPEPGKKAAAYAARRQSIDRKTIPDAMEPMEFSRASRVTRLPVRTAPVVTRQIMEDRILEGEMRRAERSGSRSDRGVSERSERPPTPRSSAQRAVRSRPTSASRPQSSGATRGSSPSAASPSSSSKSSRRGSSKPTPQR
jgi:hypothetical protein